MHLTSRPYSLLLNISDTLNFRTITKTTTVLTTTTLTPVKKREAAAIEQRQVTVQPSSVPTYASACSGTVRYSSACSCWGITAKTTTAPTPLTTTTKTVTATITVTACPTGETKCGSTCQDLLNDPKNCGTCGNVVSTLNIVAVRNSGQAHKY